MHCNTKLELSVDEDAILKLIIDLRDYLTPPINVSELNDWRKSLFRIKSNHIDLQTIINSLRKQGLIRPKDTLDSRYEFSFEPTELGLQYED